MLATELTVFYCGAVLLWWLSLRSLPVSWAIAVLVLMALCDWLLLCVFNSYINTHTEIESHVRRTPPNENVTMWCHRFLNPFSRSRKVLQILNLHWSNLHHRKIDPVISLANISLSMVHYGNLNIPLYHYIILFIKTHQITLMFTFIILLYDQ